MSCIRAIESSAASGQYGASELAERMAHTITFAKHKIALKDRDFEVAESSLRVLLKLPLVPFELLLNAVKRFSEESVNHFHGKVPGSAELTQRMATHTEIYKSLAAKYPM